MVTLPEPATTEQGWDDLRPLLDEELGRLPARYRSVLVLCDMEGRTRKDAARHLRCPEGTVSTRLARGRALLAQRLTRRGVALGGGVLASLLSEHATASVPPTLVDSTIQCVDELYPARRFGHREWDGARHGDQQNCGVRWMGHCGHSRVGHVWSCCLLPPSGAGNGRDEKHRKRKTPRRSKIWSAQLGNDTFAQREEAEKALRKMGGKAYPAVKAGLKSKVPEIVQRCERMLPDLRVAALAARDHPLWIRYQKAVGKTDDDYKLYVAAVSDKRRAEYFEGVETNPETAGAVYQRELDRALQTLSERYEEAREKGKYNTGLIHPSVGTPSHGEMAALLFLGTFPATAKTTPTFRHPWLDGHYFNLMTMPRDSTVRDAEKRLYGAWLAARREPVAIRIGLQRAAYFEIAEAIPTARSIAADEKLAIGDRVLALFVVAQSGDKADVALCEPLFKSTDVYDQRNYSEKDGKVYPIITQVRDVAIAMALILHGEEPVDYEYEFLVIYKARGSEMRKKCPFYGFRSDAGRKAAHEKANAFFAKATQAPKPK